MSSHLPAQTTSISESNLRLAERMGEKTINNVHLSGNNGCIMMRECSAQLPALFPPALLSSRCRPHRVTRQSTPLRKIALSLASYRSSNRHHAQLSPPRYRDRHRWMKIPSQEFRHRPEANEERPGDLSGLSRTLDRFSPLRWARSRRPGTECPTSFNRDGWRYRLPTTFDPLLTSHVHKSHVSSVIAS
ncbi:hypothetical protein Bbelb_325630 [Branchiostoma belcheri]|nr:hypothetical protein Bbelb_325630 [Branchiostoma belcheri]